jgi:hypothetical protein
VIVAERLVDYLERAGFVVLKRAPAIGHIGLARIRRRRALGRGCRWRRSPASTSFAPGQSKNKGLVELSMRHILAAAIAAATLLSSPANAVVYCKTVGVPKGCVARPAPVHRVYCTRPGYPHGCVFR